MSDFFARCGPGSQLIVQNNLWKWRSGNTKSGEIIENAERKNNVWHARRPVVGVKEDPRTSCSLTDRPQKKRNLAPALPRGGGGPA